MTGITRLLLTAFAIFAGAISSRGAEVIPPKPAGYFNDYAGVVSKEAALRLNEQLAQFERDTSNQVVVAVFRKMQTDSSVDDYTHRVAQAWAVGQKDRRNGAVLFVFVDDRKMFIQTGYGLEGALPDATAFDITERHIKPRFKSNDYEGGLAVGVDLMMKAIRGEYTGSGQTDLEKSAAAKDATSNGCALAFIILLIVFLMIVRLGRRLGGYGYSRRGGPFIFSGWGGGGGGGWGGGSSGGGGFSGFSGGGGSFGGGGAGSSW